MQPVSDAYNDEKYFTQYSNGEQTTAGPYMLSGQQTFQPSNSMGGNMSLSYSQTVGTFSSAQKHGSEVSRQQNNHLKNID